MSHNIQTKANYISISNLLHLLSTPASIPCIRTVLACLDFESKRNCKFSSSEIFCLIVESCFHPSRALSRSLELFTLFNLDVFLLSPYMEAGLLQGVPIIQSLYLRPRMYSQHCFIVINSNPKPNTCLFLLHQYTNALLMYTRKPVLEH